MASVLFTTSAWGVTGTGAASLRGRSAHHQRGSSTMKMVRASLGGGGDSSAFTVGKKVKVKSSVVVYHVPKTKGAATDLMGREGVVESRADDFKGVSISATLPVRIAFPLEGGKKTFVTHMMADELDIL